MSESTKIIRVATFNNFNYSDEEIEQLAWIQLINPDYKVFVNSNSLVELRPPFPAIVTINPGLVAFNEPKGDISLIKAARIKYVENAVPEVQKAFKKSMTWCKQKKIPALITYMRFTSKETMNKFTTNPDGYEWKRNYYRIREKPTWKSKSVFYCDLNDGGCPECGNCAKLTYNDDNKKIYSINLSSSGYCKHNCPDCYVKKLMFMTNNRICFDKVIQNNKQKGHKEVTTYESTTYNQSEIPPRGNRMQHNSRT